MHHHLVRQQLSLGGRKNWRSSSRCNRSSWCLPGLQTCLPGKLCRSWLGACRSTYRGGRVKGHHVRTYFPARTDAVTRIGLCIMLWSCTQSSCLRLLPLAPTTSEGRTYSGRRTLREIRHLGRKRNLRRKPGILKPRGYWRSSRPGIRCTDPETRIRQWCTAYTELRL
jgi:hypothetical protein